MLLDDAYEYFVSHEGKSIYKSDKPPMLGAYQLSEFHRVALALHGEPASFPICRTGGLRKHSEVLSSSKTAPNSAVPLHDVCHKVKAASRSLDRLMSIKGKMN